MWRLPEYQIDNSYINISMAASYHRVTNGIHVLLADHDHKFLTSTADMLKRHLYKVTMVDCASAALSILSQKEEKFDAVIANIHSPDLQGFKLLRQAVSMDLLVILLCDQEDAEMAVRLIDHGAFVLLDKPICQDTLKNLWQHVMRERKQRVKEMEKNREVINNSDKGKGVRLEENNNFENDNYRGKGKRSRQSLNDARGQSLARVKRKTCTEWTVELHEKFMDAVHQLGDGRCYPKEILELMNVPGLTRMQVASHLQKCRNDNWRAPEERKAPPSIVSPASGSVSRTEQRRFGSMPRLTTGNGNSQHQNLSRQQRESTRSPEVQSSPSINGVLDRQYLTIGATYASKLDSSSPQSVVQPYDGTSGQAQAQAQAPIVGSINYRSGGMRLGAQNGDVWLEGNGGGVLNGLGGNFYSDKDDFSDDPSNTTTGDDSYATPPPPRHHRRLQSDDFFNFNDEEYEYLIQDFPDNHARQGVGLQANHNASSSEYDKGFNVVQKEAKGQSSEMLNIPKISP